MPIVARIRNLVLLGVIVSLVFSLGGVAGSVEAGPAGARASADTSTSATNARNTAVPLPEASLCDRRGAWAAATAVKMAVTRTKTRPLPDR